MLRPLYRCVLRLHPPGFRKRFADEMLSIFDQTAGKLGEVKLLADGLLSLVRQWTLRPEFWHEISPTQQPAPDGIPRFHSLDPFRPRPSAVIHGLVLSTVVFSLTCFAIRYSWIHILRVRIREVQSDSPPSTPTDYGPVASARSSKPPDLLRPEQVAPLDLPTSPSSALNLPVPVTSPASAVQDHIRKSPVTQSSSVNQPESLRRSNTKPALAIARSPMQRPAATSAKTFAKPPDLRSHSPLFLDRSGLLQPQALQLRAQEATASTLPTGIENAFLDAEHRQRVIQAAVANLTKYYVDPDVAQRMAGALLAHEKNGDDEAAIDGEVFAGLLTKQMMEVSHDKYVMVTYSADVDSSHEGPPTPTSDEVARYRKEMEENNCTIETARILPHNVGYLKFNAFPDAAVCGKTMAAAMTSLNHSDAVIFDLRDNRGGYANMVALIATYLFDRPTHLNDFYDRAKNSTEQSWTLPPVPGNRLTDKPIFVLTSSTTFSAAEGFAYDLKMLHRATLVGETTSGRGHMGMPRRIDDHFTIRIPGMRVINPISRTNWEGTGVEPDVEVKAADALATATMLAEKTLQK